MKQGNRLLKIVFTRLTGILLDINFSLEIEVPIKRNS